MGNLAGSNPYVAAASAGFQMDMQRNAALTSGVNGEIMAIARGRQADAELITSQQAAAAERKRARYLISRAMAVAGASGAGASDKTVTDIIDGINTEGEMNALNALYTGKVRAEGIRKGAEIAKREGDARMASGMAQSVATGANAFMDFAKDNPGFFQKYGGDRAARTIGNGSYTSQAISAGVS